MSRFRGRFMAGRRTSIRRTVSGTVSFMSNWGTDANDGGYQMRQAVATNRMQPNGETAPNGAAVCRIEVRQGDDPINSSGERAEVLRLGSPGVEDPTVQSTVFFGCTKRIPSGFAGEARGSNWTILLQLRGDTLSPVNPVWALGCGLNNSNVVRWRLETRAGDFSGSPPFVNYELGNANFDTWEQFIIGDVFHRTAGSLRIWRRQWTGSGWSAWSQVLNVSNLATVQWNGPMPGDGTYYVKEGLYRNEAARTDVCFMANFARGSTFEAVEYALNNNAVP